MTTTRYAESDIRMSNRRLLIILIVVVLLIGAGLAGYLYLNRPKPVEAPIPVAATGAGYPVTFDRTTGVVTLGVPRAPTTVDLYEDFMSPDAVRFQQTVFPGLERQIVAGQVQVHEHLVGLLSGESMPLGYSLRAANAAMAVATVVPMRFPDFRASLIAAQPPAGTPGYSATQLTSLGNRLGVTDSALSDIITGSTYGPLVNAAANTDVHSAELWTTNATGALAFHVPTVVVNGRTVPNWADPGWLNRLGTE